MSRYNRKKCATQNCRGFAMTPKDSSVPVLLCKHCQKGSPLLIKQQSKEEQKVQYVEPEDNMKYDKEWKKRLTKVVRASIQDSLKKLGIEDKYPRPEECPICCTEDDECGLIELDPCQHWCCEACIVKSGKLNCPFCRVGLKMDTRLEAKTKKVARLHREEQERAERLQIMQMVESEQRNHLLDVQDQINRLNTELQVLLRLSR